MFQVEKSDKAYTETLSKLDHFQSWVILQEELRHASVVL